MLKITNILVLYVLCAFYCKVQFVFLKKMIYCVISNSDLLVVKFIQWMSMQTNSVDKKLIEIFAIFKENYPGHNFNYTLSVLKEAHGPEFSNIYQSVDPIPLASGSIAQVHKGKLNNGRIVAIKIKHPNVDKTVVDYESFVRKFMKFSSKIIGCDINIDINDFYSGILEQINFEREGEKAKIFGKIFKNSQKIIVPEVLFSNINVIVYAYEYSMAFDNFCLHANFDEQKTAILNFISCIQSTIIAGNIVHGDIHDGNWGINDNDQIVLYDFGFVRDISCDLLLKMQKMSATRDVLSLMYMILTNNNTQLTDKSLSNLNNFKLNEHTYKCEIAENISDMNGILKILYSANANVGSSILNLSINTSIMEKYVNKYNLDHRNDGDTTQMNYIQKLYDSTKSIVSVNCEEFIENYYDNLIGHISSHTYIKNKIKKFIYQLPCSEDTKMLYCNIFTSIVNLLLIFNKMTSLDIVDIINLVQKEFNTAVHSVELGDIMENINLNNFSIGNLLYMQKKVLDVNYDEFFIREAEISRQNIIKCFENLIAALHASPNKN